MRVTLHSGLVRQSNNRPSGLIFYFYGLALVGPGPLLALLNFGSLSALARCWPLFLFLAHCRPISKFGSLSTLARYRPFWICIHQPPAAVVGRPPTSIFSGSLHHLRTVPHLRHRRHHNFRFQTQGCRIFHLEFEGDARIYYSLGLLYFLLEFISYLN
jgi:hypothetical protein